MLEARAIIPDIVKCIQKIESLGGTFKNTYSFTDVIYIPKDRSIDLRTEFIRLRLYKQNGWPTKDIVLTHKKSHWHKDSKTDVLLVKKEFDELRDAKAFIDKHYDRKVTPAFKYSRSGAMYQLGDLRLYVESIEKFPPSIEVQSDSESKIADIFKLLGATKRIDESAPEFMRKILK